MHIQETDLITYLQDCKTEDSIVQLIFNNVEQYKKIDTNEAKNSYTAIVYNWFLNECIKRNQYLYFSTNKYERIQNLYKQLVLKLVELPIGTSITAIRKIVKEHRKNLIKILEEVEGISEEKRFLFPCAEYSMDLQLKILRISLESLKEPVLDIGCGKNALIVKELLKMHKAIYGIDQYMQSEFEQNIFCVNWLEFDYKPNYWETIISHMAFSNHFIYALNSGTAALHDYEKTYHKILSSLKVGGTFIYAPSIKHIEEKLNREKYVVKQYKNIEGEIGLNTTHVIKIE
jgi:hypothetical protein